MRSFLKSTLEILNHPLNRRSKIKTILKLFWWKINQLFFKLPVLIEIYPNRKCVCYPNSSFGSLIVYTNRPEFMEMKLTELILKEDSVFFDVGSGIGDFSLIASGKIKKGTIFAFEPSKKPLKNLRENVAINFLDNKIKIFNQVVSDRIGRIYFEEKNISEISHISLSKKGNRKKTNTLDIIISDNNIKKVDLIKVDVEGAESLVLKGLENSLKKNIIKSLIMELNSNSKLFNSSRNKIINNLIKNNFKIYLINKSSLSIFNKKLIDKNKTINILAIHKSFKNKKLISKFLI
jgi:FkbM family methyltransferase